MPNIKYRPAHAAVIALVGLDPEQDRRMLLSLHSYTQSNFQIYVVYLGEDMTYFTNLKQTTPRWWVFSFSTAGAPTALNQRIQTTGHDLYLLLAGIPTDPWAIPEMFSEMHPSKNLRVCGGRVIRNRFRYSQGTIGYRYQNTNWDHRGEDNQILLQPHRTSAVSSAAMVIESSTFIQHGLFDPALLTYYAQDYCFRIAQAGCRILQLAKPTVEVLIPLEDSLEIEAMRLRHIGFVDPYAQYTLA